MTIPKASVSGPSLAIVEDFYSDSSTDELPGRLEKTPPDQLLELARRIVQSHRRLENRLNLPSKPEPPHFLSDEIYFKGGKDFPLSEGEHLKHLLLYCDRLVLPDPLIDWAELVAPELEAGWGSEDEVGWAAPSAVRALRELLPLRELVLSGQLTLIGSAQSFSPTAGLEEYGRGRYTLDFYLGRDETTESHVPEFWNRDPYLAWLIVRHLRVMEDWELEAQGLNDVYLVREAAERVLNNLDAKGRYLGYGSASPVIVGDSLASAYSASGLTWNRVRKAVQFAGMTHEVNVSPVASDPEVREHLIRSSRVAMGEEPYGAVGPSVNPDLSIPVHYRIPSVSGVSLQDIIKLRLNEELYADVRTSLTALAQSVEELGTIDTYGDYQRTVVEVADEIVRPTYERLNTKMKRVAWASKIGGLLTSGAIRLGFAGLAAASHGTASPVAKAAVPASRKAQNLAQKAISRGQKEREVATTLLMSVLR